SGRPEYHGQGVVYPGNYADPPMTESQLTGQADEHGNLLPSNPETSGRSLEQMAVAACLSAYCFARQFKRATGCRHTTTASPAAPSGRSSPRNEPVTASWRRGPPAPASRTRASSPITSSASLGSPGGGSGRPQEPPNRPQAPPRIHTATPLPFLTSRAGRR